MPVVEAEVRVDPRIVVLTVRDEAERSLGSTANGRIGRLANAVVELHDQAREETSRRFDRIETLMAVGFAGLRSEFRADLAEVTGEVRAVKADVADVKADVAGFKADVKADMAGVKADVADVKVRLTNVEVSLDRLSTDVRQVVARNEELSGWVARDERGGKK
jgi:HSP20 family molecular chaperone IbpA